MQTAPFIIERVFDAPISKVWSAITDNEEMKHWYFQLADFKAEPGFEFSFTGGTKEKQYIHRCKVVEVVSGRKLSYTWRYEGYEGNSMVSFELFPEGEKTRLQLTHTGLETFPSQNDPNFAQESFAKGWTAIIGTSLKNYLEPEAS